MIDTKESERQYWGYRIWEIETKHKVLLNRRIAPLLTDAVDAIEIDAPSTALKRIKAVLKVIEESSS
tara:strand:- start:1192 stop:1392 length:201 start_codon:yes stop_codon:yes gene_type:complete